MVIMDENAPNVNEEQFKYIPMNTFCCIRRGNCSMQSHSTFRSTSINASVQNRF